MPPSRRCKLLAQTCEIHVGRSDPLRMQEKIQVERVKRRGLVSDVDRVEHQTSRAIRSSVQKISPSTRVRATRVRSSSCCANFSARYASMIANSDPSKPSTNRYAPGVVITFEIAANESTDCACSPNAPQHRLPSAKTVARAPFLLPFSDYPLSG